MTKNERICYCLLYEYDRGRTASDRLAFGNIRKLNEENAVDDFAYCR